MAPNKIKLHNLDEEVINYFLNKDTKIIYDYLAEDIISDIKNDSSDIGYNDTELRNRIISLEDNNIDTSVIQSNYYNKTETYSRSEIDLLISNNNELINKTKKLIPKLPKEVQSDLDSLSDMIKNLQNIALTNLHENNNPKKNQTF